MKIRNMTKIGLMVAVIAICAQIAIPLPFSPVPLTLQTMAVMIVGLILGAKAGSLTVIIYVLAGVAGLPVFTQARAGLGALASPSGGFIFGFILAALIIGLLAGKEQLTWKKGIFACACGLIAIYTLGVTQMKFVLDVSWQEAFLIGVLPYLPLEAVKVFLSTQVAIALNKAIPKLIKTS